MSRLALDVGVTSLTLPGEDECGDLYLTVPFAEGVLVAVVDGIGHGAEAAHAAETAIGILRSHPHEPIVSLINRCHENLRATRGAVMSLASINTLAGTMTWVGVGNVEGKLLPVDADPPQTLLLSAGMLGRRLAPVYPSVVPIKSGDTLILATDGVREDFYHGLNLKQSPQKLAELILARCARHTDDALVLVGRYVG